MADQRKCEFCENLVDEDDECFGCNSFVCEDCNVNWGLMGPHDVIEHTYEPDDD